MTRNQEDEDYKHGYHAQPKFIGGPQVQMRSASLPRDKEKAPTYPNPRNIQQMIHHRDSSLPPRRAPPVSPSTQYGNSQRAQLNKVEPHIPSPHDPIVQQFIAKTVKEAWDKWGSQSCHVLGAIGRVANDKVDVETSYVVTASRPRANTRLRLLRRRMAIDAIADRAAQIANHAFTEDAKIESYEDDNDGDDERDDEGRLRMQDLKLRPLPAIPSTTFRNPFFASPFQNRAASSDPPQLYKGSDGLRDRRHFGRDDRGNSRIIGDVAATRRRIQEALPSYTAAQAKRLKNQKRELESSRSPSSKGSPSPRPWPKSPRVPTKNHDRSPSLEHVRAKTSPLPANRFTSLRTHSESPKRSRTRLRKHRARLSDGNASAPPTTLHLQSEPESSTEPNTYQRGIERGRTRLRKGSPAALIAPPPRYPSQTSTEDEIALRERSPLPTISNPVLQASTQPIAIPSVCLPKGSPTLQGASTAPMTPSPLATEQKRSASEGSSPGKLDIERPELAVDRASRRVEIGSRTRDGPGLKTMIIDGFRNLDLDAEYKSDADG
ncbi:hypothetical protein N0V90_004172 [Kalmusia sp. IMI 367209]|nr:hypothetical protein N0V90_004172 [Kalmusia sp. IMI 367209]